MQVEDNDGNVIVHGIKMNNWFDTTKTIPKEDLEIALSQMALYAYKDGDDPDGKEARRSYRQMKLAVRTFNKRFK